MSRCEGLLDYFVNIQNTRIYFTLLHCSEFQLVPMFYVEIFGDVSGTVCKGICKIKKAILNTVVFVNKICGLVIMQGFIQYTFFLVLFRDALFEDLVSFLA